MTKQNVKLFLQMKIRSENSMLILDLLYTDATIGLLAEIESAFPLILVQRCD
jgi:hypothetical protein